MHTHTHTHKIIPTHKPNKMASEIIPKLKKPPTD